MTGRKRLAAVAAVDRGRVRSGRRRRHWLAFACRGSHPVGYNEAEHEPGHYSDDSVADIFLIHSSRTPSDLNSLTEMTATDTIRPLSMKHSSTGQSRDRIAGEPY